MNLPEISSCEGNTLRPYQPPAIIAELELETRAGSPLGDPEGLPDLWEE